MPDIITISESALARVKHLVDMRDPAPKGIRVSLKTKGCSGLSYAVSFVDEVDPLDDVVIKDGMMIYIDPKAVLYLLGSENH